MQGANHIQPVTIIQPPIHNRKSRRISASNLHRFRHGADCRDHKAAAGHGAAKPGAEGRIIIHDEQGFIVRKVGRNISHVDFS